MAQEENTTPSFLGKGWSFPPLFSLAQKGVVMVADEEDIRQSLQILLSTALGERVMQPKYGCNLNDLLFEPLNTTVRTYIRGLVKQAILIYEPRIQLNDVAIEMLDEPSGRVDLVVDYTVRTTNSRYNLVYPFYREEATVR
ncbi:MAG: GPW/gp25 family protein [Desulfobacterales bacterium]|nr:GPW/gp25 family protein [Desulfobacterales bacterium]